MKLGNLIAVRSEKGNWIHCEACDSGGGTDIKKWYEYTWYSDTFKCEMTGKALDCCKKYGTVIDWRVEE